MSRKRTTYSAEFKTKMVLEAVQNEYTLNAIASKNNIKPKIFKVNGRILMNIYRLILN